MTEAQLVARVVKYLRTRFREAVVFKHNDRITAGVPDISITRRPRVTWLEAKMFRTAHPAESEIKKHFTPLQFERMKQLNNLRHGYYVVGYHDAEQRPRFTVTNPEFAREFWNYLFEESSTFDGDLEQLLRFV